MFKKIKKISLILSFLALLLVGGISTPQVSFAQLDTGLSAVGEQSGLTAEDPKVIIARVIRTGIGFLGVIAVIIVLYGGFVWMTAGGEEEKVNKAKKILINGVVGLIIVLLSWSITTFVISSIRGAGSGSTTGSGSGGSSGGIGIGLGGGAVSSFSATSFRPEGEVTIRNIVPQITFSRQLDPASVDGNVVVTDVLTNQQVDGNLVVSGNKITFTPSETCPGYQDRFCFAENTTYNITVNTNIKSTVGTGLRCFQDCSAVFTTGTIIDTDDPSVNMTLPWSGDRTDPGVVSLVMADGTDDSQLSVADFSIAGTQFDSVPATGDDLANVIFKTDWDNSGVSPDSIYKLAVAVSDLAGNIGEDSVNIRVNPPYCSNRKLDTDLGEEGIDCGGACGACEGASCTENFECSSGNCVSGTCTTTPVITDISPPGGAIGTYVTVSGEGFGRSTGVISFADGVGGQINASIPSCSSGWSSNEVVVEVPEGAVSGAVTVTTADNLIDSTNDIVGPNIPDFDVNTVVTPNLCKISPNSGLSGSNFTLNGSGFGSLNDNSKILFDVDLVTDYVSWSDGSINASVPVLNAQPYQVFVDVEGVQSNALTYNVRALNTGGLGQSGDTVTKVPKISYITPESGGVGQYISIVGSDFGTKTGKVILTSRSTGYSALGSIDFPPACLNDFWKNNEITVIIPAVYTNGEPVDATIHDLTIVTGNGTSEPVEFLITSSSPTPGICAITPNRGIGGDNISISGTGFGSIAGNAIFYNEVSVPIQNWADDLVDIEVASTVTTGPVVIETQDGQRSNQKLFEFGVNDGSTDNVGVVESAGYAWSFSTGEVLKAPVLRNECSADYVSAVPNAKYTKSVCVNASVYGEFTGVPVDDLSLIDGDTVKIEECLNTDCSNSESVQGTLLSSSSSDESTFSWVPVLNYNGGKFKTNTDYRVTLTTGITGINGISMKNDESWRFSVGSSGTDCKVEQVRVSPNKEILTGEGDTSEFVVQPETLDCQKLNAMNYSWSWEVDNSFASILEGACNNIASDSCAVVTALAEGETDVQATEDASQVTDKAKLIIDFSDPYVNNSWPGCDSACIDGEVGASFNTAMDKDSVTAAGNARILECRNELCIDFEGTVADKAILSLDDDNKLTQLSFGNIANLKPGKFYRVILSGDIQSSSKVKLTRLNYGSDFSWIFRTKSENAECSIARVELVPKDAVLSAVGEVQDYRVEAYGDPDGCSVQGQKLNPYKFSWAWEDPIVNDSDVAEWLKINNSLFDVDNSSLQTGCTSSCLASGSTSYPAICGNSSIEIGEDCDDGDNENGDGCSSQCVSEGSIDGSVCGNGIIENDATTLAGEECDDGNTADGDGCSSTCVREGSGTVGLSFGTCGNNDVARDENGAGEDCDDGNRTNGDGCSSQCLNEGTSSLAVIGGAICGNNVIDAPYETCDDGNIADGDGCSSSCLKEGSIGDSVCGDGNLQFNAVTGAGEECETTQEGCGSDCLWLGSNANYSVPSVCGDGVVGIGELNVCEAGAVGDGNIDPSQSAKILDTANTAVDLDTKLASTTVKVSSVDYLDVIGETSLSLRCSAERDEQCSGATGPGNNFCCFDRPTVTANPNAQKDVCRNASIYATFDQQMNESSFQDNLFVKLELQNGDKCPDGYEIYEGNSITYTGSWLKKTWLRVKNWIAPKTSASAEDYITPGECLLPITGIDTRELENGNSLVELNYGVALEENATYNIIVGGDILGDVGDNNRALKKGVLSSNNVAIDGTLIQSFTTGNEVCGIDQVEVTDLSPVSPAVFSTFEETHNFRAEAYSNSKGQRQKITPIKDVYNWSWLDWQEDSGIKDIIRLITDGAPVDKSEVFVQAGNDNGVANVVAQAVISAPGSVDDGKIISGSLEVTTFACQNPWPTYEDGFPFNDDKLNFSTYFCRDKGKENDTSDDLPSVATVSPDGYVGSRLQGEYLFKVNNGTGDAIGVRIDKNETYLDPMSWYYAQGFNGSPELIEVDGYPAVQDGDTVYISAPNVVNSDTDTNIYPNVYVFSKNRGAQPDTSDIFAQMLNNLDLTNNLSVALCQKTNGEYTGDVCSTDLDCAGDQVCGSDHDKIARDMQRLANLRKIESAIDVFGQSNKLCSKTTTQNCRVSADCPGDELCLASVPQIVAGTPVPSLVSSVWSSWKDVLGNAIGAELPTDPINKYAKCPDGFNGDNCVNRSNGQYVCPTKSLTTHYQSVGPFGYLISSDLEYKKGNWAWDFDTNNTDKKKFKLGANIDSFPAGFVAGNTCDTDVVLGDSEVCGDGVVGANEVCEVGQLGNPKPAYCDSQAQSPDGTISQVCNSSCDGWVDDPTVECVPYTCGNGNIDPGEECDDGSFNGRYGFCGNNCKFDQAFWCGDGELAGGESCDCGIDGTTGRSLGGSSCTVGNGAYSANPNTSCSWDCSGPASYCGDGVVDSGEQCDGNQDTYAGKTCDFGDDVGQKCANDSDCSYWEDVGTDIVNVGATCGQSANGAACPITTVCLAGDEDKIGRTCVTDTNCGVPDGLCSTNPVQTERVKTCADNGASGDQCTWNSSSWNGLDCVAPINCGNGIVDQGEECDDGNKDTNDECTNQCTTNVCGDGYLYVGVEECDEGVNNDKLCSAPYQSNCSFCSGECKTLSTSGSYCGDNTKDYGEVCDGSDVPYRYVKLVADKSQTKIGGACDETQVNDPPIDIDADGNADARCRNVGVCDGGELAGEFCLNSNSCGGNDCVKPSCANDCQSTCPFTFDLAPVEIKTNQEGSTRSLSAKLQSTDIDTDVVTANSATLYVPACNASSALTANIDTSKAKIRPAQVVFVTDLSWSMQLDKIDGVRKIKLVKDAVKESISSLFDELEDGVRIGTIGYKKTPDDCRTAGDTIITETLPISNASNPLFNDLCAKIPCSLDINANNYDATCEVTDTNSQTGFLPTPTSKGTFMTRGDVVIKNVIPHRLVQNNDESELVDHIDEKYIAEGGTYTFEGLAGAKLLLDNSSGQNTRKVVILMTDGAWDANQNDPEYMACSIKDAGYELYTVGVISGNQVKISPDGSECDKYIDPADGKIMSLEEYLKVQNTISVCGQDFYNVCSNTTINPGYVEAARPRLSAVDICPSGQINLDSPDPTRCFCNDSPNAINSCGAGIQTNSTGTTNKPPRRFNNTNGLRNILPLQNNTLKPIRRLGTFNWLKNIGDRLKTQNVIAKVNNICTNKPNNLSILKELACWSSGNPNPNTGIDYSYSISANKSVSDLYGEIIDSIISSSISILYNGERAQALVRDGSNLELPLPTNFSCDPDKEQELILQVLFKGTGTIELDNIKLKSCGP